MYYRGQRLGATANNPVIYRPGDFAVFEGLGTDGSLDITIVQKRRKIEPFEWWAAVVEGDCAKRCLALYRSKIPCKEILILIESLNPLIKWKQLPPTIEPLNPYRFEGFLNKKSRIIELDPDLVNTLDESGLKVQLIELGQAIFADLCQP